MPDPVFPGGVGIITNDLAGGVQTNLGLNAEAVTRTITGQPLQSLDIPAFTLVNGGDRVAAKAQFEMSSPSSPVPFAEAILSINGEYFPGTVYLEEGLEVFFTADVILTVVDGPTLIVHSANSTFTDGNFYWLDLSAFPDASDPVTLAWESSLFGIGSSVTQNGIETAKLYSTQGANFRDVVKVRGIMPIASTARIFSDVSFYIPPGSGNFPEYNLPGGSVGIGQSILVEGYLGATNRAGTDPTDFSFVVNGDELATVTFGADIPDQRVYFQVGLIRTGETDARLYGYASPSTGDGTTFIEAEITLDWDVDVEIRFRGAGGSGDTVFQNYMFVTWAQP